MESKARPFLISKREIAEKLDCISPSGRINSYKLYKVFTEDLLEDLQIDPEEFKKTQGFFTYRQTERIVKTLNL
jgi:hypothetical protein